MHNPMGYSGRYPPGNTEEIHIGSKGRNVRDGWLYITGARLPAKNRHYAGTGTTHSAHGGTGQSHLSVVPSDFTGNIAGSRHYRYYSTGPIEGPLLGYEYWMLRLRS